MEFQSHARRAVVLQFAAVLLVGQVSAQDVGGGESLVLYRHGDLRG